MGLWGRKFQRKYHEARAGMPEFAPRGWGRDPSEEPLTREQSNGRPRALESKDHQHRVRGRNSQTTSTEYEGGTARPPAQSTREEQPDHQHRVRGRNSQTTSTEYEGGTVRPPAQSTREEQPDHQHRVRGRNSQTTSTEYEGGTVRPPAQSTREEQSDHQHRVRGRNSQTTSTEYEGGTARPPAQSTREEQSDHQHRVRGRNSQTTSTEYEGGTARPPAQSTREEQSDHQHRVRGRNSQTTSTEYEGGTARPPAQSTREEQSDHQHRVRGRNSQTTSTEYEGGTARPPAQSTREEQPDHQHRVRGRNSQTTRAQTHMLLYMCCYMMLPISHDHSQHLLHKASQCHQDQAIRSTFNLAERETCLTYHSNLARNLWWKPRGGVSKPCFSGGHDPNACLQLRTADFMQGTVIHTAYLIKSSINGPITNYRPITLRLQTKYSQTHNSASPHQSPFTDPSSCSSNQH
ncbi:uncharacterized protein LOC143508958 [Brachyhypopomus gauderio]|uniref:uncharacterized protein LOC143508958 n=1 Tax=Brachyhypopomus gauderio TaxID=698409 RepID=UPI0040436B28